MTDDDILEKILRTKDPVSKKDTEPLKEENIRKNETVRKVEDKDEDFEFIGDYIKGPKFNEPTEDQILEKILKDANNENIAAQDYEVKGKKKDDTFDNFDINKLFEKPKQNELDEEDFYSKFMDKYKPPVKKELPILKVSYKFDKLPDNDSISKEQNVIDSNFYKYKPMLDKATDLIKRKRIKDAMNYYQVVLDQEIPEEFKKMIKKNLEDLKEYLEKYINS